MGRQPWRLSGRVGVAVVTLCLAIVFVDILGAGGANAGMVIGYTAAFAIWLVLLALGWRWFKHLDSGDDGGADGT